MFAHCYMINISQFWFAFDIVPLPLILLMLGVCLLSSVYIYHMEYTWISTFKRALSGLSYLSDSEELERDFSSSVSPSNFFWVFPQRSSLRHLYLWNVFLHRTRLVRFLGFIRIIWFNRFRPRMFWVFIDFPYLPLYLSFSPSTVDSELELEILTVSESFSALFSGLFSLCFGNLSSECCFCMF